MRDLLKAVLVLLVVGMVMPSCMAQIQSIAVDSSWVGLGSKHSSLQIEWRDGQYVANGKPIPKEKVDAFLHVLQAPVMTAPEAHNLGITAVALRFHVESGLNDDASRFMTKPHLLEKHQAFRKIYLDEAAINARLGKLFGFTHTDDYPQATVSVVMRDGSKWVLETASQGPYMLPWTVKQGKTSARTYNADVSRALGALLPAGFTNGMRFVGEGEVDSMLSSLASLIGMEVEERK